MTQYNFTLAALATLALAACQQAGDDSNIAIDNGINAAEAAEADVEALPASEAPSDDLAAAPPTNNAAPLNEADDGGSELPPTTLIPAQYRGRWGMVAADCTSTRGDAKGLMTVGETSIRFYESTAALQERRPAIATSFSGVFSFSGEGQTWERVMTLTRTGDSLKRDQADGNFTYTRCA